MILLFGFNTPRRDELPAEIKCAVNGSEALKFIEEMDKRFPRIGRMDFPIPRTVKNYRLPAAPTAAHPEPPAPAAPESAPTAAPDKKTKGKK